MEIEKEITSRFFSIDLFPVFFLLFLLSLILISSSGSRNNHKQYRRNTNIGNHPDYPLNGECIDTGSVASDTIKWNIRAVSLPMILVW
jgi:hypothetical protein